MSASQASLWAALLITVAVPSVPNGSADSRCLFETDLCVVQAVLTLAVRCLTSAGFKDEP